MVTTYALIESEAQRRGITRLCHFTPSRNLAHVGSDPRGLLASRHLRDDERRVFNPTDFERLDGYPQHICCSVQYPNAWYFRTARGKDPVFRDWVVIFIKSNHLWRRGTKFCPRNAAGNSGAAVQEGEAAFEALFASSVVGNRAHLRGARHPDFLPTDEQAEVLIPDVVAREDIIGIAVRDRNQAMREVARLKILGLALPTMVVVPEFYSPGRLSKLLRAGLTPAEREFH